MSGKRGNRPSGSGSRQTSARRRAEVWRLPLQRAVLGLLLCAPAGCTTPLAQVVAAGWQPEVQALPIQDPPALPPAPIPAIPPPATVTDDPKQLKPRPMSLNEAVRLTLENAKAVRVFTGLGATNSGRTIYDAAITATTIDQQQARFDPTLTAEQSRNRTETPQLGQDPSSPSGVGPVGTRVDVDRSAVGLERLNPLGGRSTFGLSRNTTELNPAGSGFNVGGVGFIPGVGSSLGGGLNPESRPALELAYTQPLLQGGGFLVNTAPIVLARLDTERSYFQFKDATQELVRGTIEAYWNLVFARLDVWAREIQVEQADEALRREEARRKAGIGDIRGVAQARVTLNQFKAGLVAARASVLSSEGALRNVIGLPPSDGTLIVPVSAPASERFKPEWDALLRFAEQRRPDLIELKLVLEADRVRHLQAENAALPRLDATSSFRWNGLDGRLSSGDRVATDFGQFTDWTVGITFSVPLGLREGRARVREQDLIILRDRANLEQGLHGAGHELAITVRELENSYEQYLAYRETRAAALTNLLVQIEERRSGRGIYLNVLQALNDWGAAITSEARALIDYNILLAALERQTGTILETHGLVFVEERFRAAGPLCLPTHDREYPQGLKPAGEPARYPDSGRPGENAFDLTRPELRPAKLKLPVPEPKDDEPPPGPKFGEGRP